MANENGDLGPLFETVVTAALRSLPGPVATRVRYHIDRAAGYDGDLTEQVSQYIIEVEHHAADGEFVDVETARLIAAACLQMLAIPQVETDAETRQLITAAALYFLDQNDVEGDIVSPVGFDDDAMVMRAVARAIGREDVLGALDDER